MSTVISSEGLETLGVLGLVLAGALATFTVWCALKMGAEVERAEAMGLVRRRH